MLCIVIMQGGTGTGPTQLENGFGSVFGSFSNGGIQCPAAPGSSVHLESSFLRKSLMFIRFFVQKYLLFVQNFIIFVKNPKSLFKIRSIVSIFRSRRANFCQKKSQIFVRYHAFLYKTH